MQFTVNSQEIQSASARITGSASTIRSEVQAMMAHLQALQGSWTGAASESFADCSRRWHLVQQQIETSLDEISMALGRAAQSYEEVENASRAMFAG